MAIGGAKDDGDAMDGHRTVRELQQDVRGLRRALRRNHHERVPACGHRSRVSGSSSKSRQRNRQAGKVGRQAGGQTDRPDQQTSPAWPDTRCARQTDRLTSRYTHMPPTRDRDTCRSKQHPRTNSQARLPRNVDRTVQRHFMRRQGQLPPPPLPGISQCFGTSSHRVQMSRTHTCTLQQQLSTDRWA
jgi:hypothetical protein